MSRLKPCPFCGEELEIIANGQYYSHKREENSEKQCFGAVWVFPIDDEEMIRRWNTRKPMDRVLEQLEVLKNLNHKEWKKSSWTGEEIMPYLFAHNSYVKAIKIVKAGGKDE